MVFTTLSLPLVVCCREDVQVKTSKNLAYLAYRHTRIVHHDIKNSTFATLKNWPLEAADSGTSAQRNQVLIELDLDV